MKTKGFTLIELLAVIVILAVIALIATPMILGIIDTARVGAAKSSAIGYIEALELYLSTAELSNKTMLESNQQYNLTDTTIIGEKAYQEINALVEVKGDKPTGYDDYIKFDNNYRVIEGQMTINGYVVIIQDGEYTVTKSGEIIEPVSMSLNIADQTMERTSTTKIKAIFEPKNTTNQKVSYTSSDSNIVSVDEYGNIKAESVGTAVITVTSDANKDIKATVNIEVVRPENVESITITKEDKEVRIGDTYQLEVVLEPMDALSNAVEWTSSNESVAIVSESGLVTGLSVGKTTITATTTNGKTATVEIEIKPILAESISISGNETVGVGTTAQYTATILPENATDKTVIWGSNDESIVTIDNTGLVTGIKEGTVTITATTSNGIESTKEINVEVLKLCKRADVTTLHTEICTQSYNACYGAKYSTGSTITYGNETVTEGELKTGDAFDCDVDGDGIYSPETERFYYVSDYYNTTTKAFETDKAVLIYYSNTLADSNGKVKPDNTSSSNIAYNSKANNYQGPLTAIKNLPTIEQWSNVRLLDSGNGVGIRAIVTESGTTSTTGGPLPTDFNYSNYAARLLTRQEINAACKVGSYKAGELDNCNYLVENTKYYSPSSIVGYWLETPRASESSYSWFVDGNLRYVNMNSVTTTDKGVRPVIELYKTDISY